MVREIAAQYDFPYDSTLRVLRQLAKAQLVTAHRGIKGGFSLNIPSSKISLLTVMEIILGPLDAYDPLPGSSSTGDKEFREVVVKDLNKIGQVLKKELSERTISTYTRMSLR